MLPNISLKKKKTIMWFRLDLRLKDNPALTAACDRGDVIPVYIYDTFNGGKHDPGSATRWWLHQSLLSLNEQLDSSLIIMSGDPKILLAELAAKSGADMITWNRNYEPWQIARDKRIIKALKGPNLDICTYNGSLLWEPWDILNKSGQPYKVFTPFYRRGCLEGPEPRKPIPVPNEKRFFYLNEMNQGIDSLKLIPKFRWHEKFSKTWEPGENEANEKLKGFLKAPVNDYRINRNVPGSKGTSKLSPHLHFGEISPNQIWYTSLNKVEKIQSNNDMDCFLSEIGWREFSYYLLYHFPDLPHKNFNSKFDNYPWLNDGLPLEAWKKGMTGVPIVDAGMRELWQTGYMHNRVRMIVGSYLVKNLNIDWREGEAWFWDCLLDADLASNSASWQWVAGSGADAAPFFRIFNPVLQGEKFDENGNYVIKYCPELGKLPKKYIHKPWEAPDDVLRGAKIVLGKNYPYPIVDLRKSRSEALEKYNLVKVS